MPKNAKKLITPILTFILLASFISPILARAATPFQMGDFDPTPEQTAGGFTAQQLQEQQQTINKMGWFTQEFVRAINWLLEKVFTACAYITGWAGRALDLSIYFSIKNNSLINDSDSIVNKGWVICRNLTNIFFIFILIFIGIATILGLQSYGYKKILISVIIAALLVNFSMMMTKLVIDASNVLAMEFLCKATNNACDASEISKVMTSGLQLQTVFGEQNMPIQDVLTKYGISEEKLPQFYLLSSGLMLLAAFVLFAGAILFIVRIVTLAFLIILSPFAFVAMAIGSGIGRNWWHKLVSQSFFAPAYMFFIYLVLSSLNGIQTITGSQNQSFAAILLKPDSASYNIFFQFIIVGGLLLGSLVVATSMGGAGAAWSMKMAQGVRRRAQGYAGRIGGAGARFAGRQTVGRVGEKAAGSKTVSNFAATSPRLGGWTKEKMQQILSQLRIIAYLLNGSLALGFIIFSQKFQRIIPW